MKVEIFYKLTNIKPNFLIKLCFRAKRIKPNSKQPNDTKNYFKSAKTTGHVNSLSIILNLAWKQVSMAKTSRLCRYFGFFLYHILKNSPFFKAFYLMSQNILMHKKYKAIFNDVYHRYRFVFPKNYTNHVNIAEVIYLTFRYRETNYLVHYLKDMFSAVNFYKHKFLLYFLRAVFSSVPKSGIPEVNGLFIKFRGKISQAGNSRRRRFLVQFGRVSTNYADAYLVEKFQIKTFTGAIGCTVIACLK